MPRLTCTRSAHRPQDAGCLERLNRFAAEHELREMKFTGRGINRLLRAAFADPVGDLFGRDAATGRRLGDELALERLAYGSGFDHPEMWGRSRQPLAMVGHPYRLDAEARELLGYLSASGLGVYVSREAGWYGHRTIHVRVWVPGALPPPTDAQRFETSMLIDEDGPGNPFGIIPPELMP